jgi:hypothetical protein
VVPVVVPVVVLGGVVVVVLDGGGGGGGGGGSCVGWSVFAGGVVVVVVVVDRFFVVVVVLVDDSGAEVLVGAVVGVPETEVLLPSSVVLSCTWTESWLVRSGWASLPWPPASMATVANAVDTTTPATPSAMYGVRRSSPPSSGGGATPIWSSPSIPQALSESLRDQPVTAGGHPAR